MRRRRKGEGMRVRRRRKRRAPPPESQAPDEEAEAASAAASSTDTLPARQLGRPPKVSTCCGITTIECDCPKCFKRLKYFNVAREDSYYETLRRSIGMSTSSSSASEGAPSNASVFDGDTETHEGWTGTWWWFERGPAGPGDLYLAAWDHNETLWIWRGNRWWRWRDWTDWRKWLASCVLTDSENDSDSENDAEHWGRVQRRRKRACLG